MKLLRKTGFIVVLSALLFISTLSAHAALELRGTDSLGNRLIYDTDFDITWYDFTNSNATWQDQMNWASALSVSGGDLVGVYDDWRLPTAMNQNGTGPCRNYNCTSSEMGHLYYADLGNKGFCDTSGNCPQTGFGLTNKGPFTNLQTNNYWSGTEYAVSSGPAWRFHTYSGYQFTSSKNLNHDALAVRPGDVAVVPEPMSMILFGVGGTVLGARRLVLRRRG